MDFSFSKQGLLDALEARREWAVALDKKQIADHKKAEKDALSQFRVEVVKQRSRFSALCAQALKLPYEQLRNVNDYSGPFSFRPAIQMLHRPQCPVSVVQSLDRAIRSVTIDERKRFRISPKGGFMRIHYLLTFDENAKKDVCAS